ncbi:hypothetical protein OHJ21_14955 [Virgibacillus sp. LDC1]|nr:hypothetical protein [Virgibacillus sp. LDC1]
MNITKCIEDILVDRFAQLGFNYEKSDTGWTFIREYGGVKEFIEIEKSNWYENAISCEYRKGTSTRNTIAFLRDRIEQVHVFSDESTLKEELKLIVDITEKYALKWFEQIKVKKKNPPDNFLKEEWAPLLQSFIRKNSIEFDNIESISILDKMLIQEVSKEEIYSISYCFGEIIKQNFGAEWDYSPEDGPYIKNIAGSKKIALKPFVLVTKTVMNPDALSLEYFFTNIKSAVDGIKN